MLTRRNAALGIASAAASTAIMLDFSKISWQSNKAWGLSKAEQLELFIKFKADLSGERSGIYYQADLFHLQQNKMLPLLVRCEGFSWNRVTKLTDNRYEATLTEVGYYLDPETGQIQDELPVPTTGEAHKLHHYTSQSSHIITPDEVLVPNFSDRPDVSVDLQNRPAVVLDDTIVFHEDLQAEFIPTSTGRIERDEQSDIDSSSGYRRVSQMTTYTGDFAKALMEDSTSVPCTSYSMMFSDSRIFIFDLDEHFPMVWRLFGRKVNSIEGLPQAFQDRVQKDHPKFWSESSI